MMILLIDELTKSEPIFKGIIYCLLRAASSDILGIVFRGLWKEFNDVYCEVNLIVKLLCELHNVNMYVLE